MPPGRGDGHGPYRRPPACRRVTGHGHLPAGGPRPRRRPRGVRPPRRHRHRQRDHRARLHGVAQCRPAGGLRRHHGGGPDVGPGRHGHPRRPRVPDRGGERVRDRPSGPSRGVHPRGRDPGGLGIGGAPSRRGGHRGHCRSQRRDSQRDAGPGRVPGHRGAGRHPPGPLQPGHDPTGGGRVRRQRPPVPRAPHPPRLTDRPRAGPSQAGPVGSGRIVRCKEPSPVTGVTA